MESPSVSENAAGCESLSSAAERLWAGAPNRYQVRAWMYEHPLLSVGGGIAAGFLATSLVRKAQRSVAASPAAPPHALGDPRVFERASSALWLIPLVELARIGMQAATYYMVSTRQPPANPDPARGR